jgi:hypothetical protein
MNARCCPLFLLCLFVILEPKLARTQTTYDALTFGSGVDAVGYSETSGWTFVPTAEMRVVAVGCFPTAPPSSVGVCFWEGTNRIIASYQISINQQMQGDVFYQAVDGLTLKVGSSYAISLDPSQGVVPLRTYSLQGAEGLPTFSPASFISQVANYFVSTNGQWAPEPAPPLRNTDSLLFGSTFKFQLLGTLTLNQEGVNLVFSWPTQSVTYLVQRSETLSNANWVTLTNAPVAVGSQNQVVIPKPERTMFFRLASQ